jgi:predicted outer membrane repeat protein
MPDAAEFHDGSHLTLSEFAANSSNYLHSNTTLVFLSGTHNLSTVNLSLSNVNSFIMKSNNSTAQIKCTSSSRIHFNQSQYIHIANLEFIGCGGNQIVFVEEFVILDASFKGQKNSETALEITETTAKIIDSTFAYNTKGSYRCVIFYHPYGCSDDGFVGGALIAINSTINISHSRFEYNRADFGGAIFVEYSIITVSGSVFISNNATIQGGGLYSSSSAVTITEACEFHANSATITGGVLDSCSSTITIEASKFHDNHANAGGVLGSLNSTITIDATEFRTNSGTNGGVLSLYSSAVTIDASIFHDNSAKTGGVLNSFGSNITVEVSKFHANHAIDQGGILSSFNSSVIIEASEFYNNIARRDGGILQINNSTIIITASEFHTSGATKDGGVLYSFHSTVTIDKSDFHSNSANNGGALFSRDSAITAEACNFYNNSAMRQGGVLYTSNSTITIGDDYFAQNGSPIGAVIYALFSTIKRSSYLLIENNFANKHAVIYLSDSEYRGYDSENFTFSGNLGSLVAFNSNITFTGCAQFMNNQPSLYTTSNVQGGGAITLFQSNIFFYGKYNFEYNHAKNGGAIQSTDSKLYLNRNVNFTIAHNTATSNGGGIYLTNSEINCQQKSTFILYNNTAACKGGGLTAISSSIKAVSAQTFLFASEAWQYTGTRIEFKKNTAKKGGGLSLEANAKLYILKYGTMYVQNDYDDTNASTAVFTANSADYGGALYVDDDTNSGTCASDTNSECFFQVDAHAIHGQEYIIKDLKTQSIYFSYNHADISGSTRTIWRIAGQMCCQSVCRSSQEICT